MICEVIGQGIDRPTNKSMVYVSVLAGSEPDLMSWAVPNLGAPNAVHLCKGDARDVDLSGADVYLLAVDAWRLRSPDSLTEPWAQAIGEAGALAGEDRDRRGAGGADRRRDDRGEGAGDDRDRGAARDDTPLREEADGDRRREAGAGGADGGVMGDVRALGAALVDGRRPPRDGVDDRAAEPPGRGRRSDRPPLGPPGGADAGLQAAQAWAGGPDRGPRGREAAAAREAEPEAPRVDLPERGRRLPAAFPPAPPGAAGAREAEPWEAVCAKGFFDAANDAKQKVERDDWTVADRLSSRHGRKHQIRTARKLSRQVQLPGHIRVPESDEEAILPKVKKKKKKDRKRRKRRRRSGSRSRSSSKRSSSTASSGESSNAVFRGASAVDVSRSRASRESAKRPHLVLVDTLYQMSRTLPRSSAEATMSKADIFRRLPPLFAPWFELKMAKILQQGGGNSLRSEREARTLVEIADALLSGATLQSLVLVLGRAG